MYFIMAPGLTRKILEVQADTQCADQSVDTGVSNCSACRSGNLFLLCTWERLEAVPTPAAEEPPRSPCQQTRAQPKAALGLDQPIDGVSGAQAWD